MNRLALVFAFLLPLISLAQPLSEQEDNLAQLLNTIRNAKSEQQRNKANTEFKENLLKAIETTGSFSYPFAQLRSIGCITSPDQKVRIYNWNIENDEDLTQNYYGFIQKYDEKKGKYQIFELKCNRMMGMMGASKSNEVVDHTNWYGALYYKILPVERNKKTYYTLLGWDGNNSMSNLKLIDALHFSGTTAKFGAPIFRQGKEALNRVWFEYAKDVTMHLNYEEKYKRIIFDHLAPQSPALTGFYSTYAPDLSHDAFVFEDGRWYLVEDVVGVNGPSQDKITIYVPNEKTGELEEKKIKNKWVEPSKQHVATLPDENGTTTKSKASTEPVRMEKPKADRKAPTSYMPTMNKKPKKRK